MTSWIVHLYSYCPHPYKVRAPSEWRRVVRSNIAYEPWSVYCFGDVCECSPCLMKRWRNISPGGPRGDKINARIASSLIPARLWCSLPLPLQFNVFLIFSFLFPRKFEICNRLGKGAYGVVFKATEKRSRAVVALKVYKYLIKLRIMNNLFRYKFPIYMSPSFIFFTCYVIWIFYFLSDHDFNLQT